MELFDKQGVKKEVKFCVVIGSVDTVAIFPIDDFSEHVMAEELSNLNEETMEKITHITTGPGVYLIEYDSIQTAHDDVEVSYKIIHERRHINMADTILIDIALLHDAQK